MSTSISENAGKRVHQGEFPPVPAEDGDIWIRGKVGHPGGDVFVMRLGGWSHRDDGDLPESALDEMKAEVKKAKIEDAKEKMRLAEEARRLRDLPQSSTEDAW